MNDIQTVISASLLRLRMKSPFFATLALFALREPELWNVAADIVVNGMIVAQGVFELPAGGVRDPKLEHLNVEEIYELLLKETEQRKCSMPDLLEGNGEGLSQKAELEAHWRNALQQATVIARTTQQGKLPAGIDRELQLLSSPQLDWRSYLWRYLVQTPTDFSGFDRRFIGRGLYLESLQGESVQVYVAVDTSGSIDPQQLQSFLSEVHGILNAYPHLICELYYVDADAYGPYELTPDSSLPKPKGGGGTSFIPFFEQVDERWDHQSQAVCVYLTDGYGSFPNQAPELPVLWVVTPGGLALEQFPFGESVRLWS